MSDSPPEKLGDVLDKSLKRLDPSGRIGQYKVWPIWNETVGPTIARNAQPERIRHGTLSVKVTSPIWMQQLQYMKEILTEKLNHQIGANVVKNIFFFVGRVESESPGPQPEHPPAPGHSREAKLDGAHLRPVKNPEIRRALTRLFTACSERQRRK